MPDPKAYGLDVLPRRPRMTPEDFVYLMRLSVNASEAARRAAEAIAEGWDNPDELEYATREEGFALGVAAVLDWLSGADPSQRLAEVVHP